MHANHRQYARGSAVRVVPMVLLMGEWRTLKLTQGQSPEIWLQITSLYGQLVVFATRITFLRELIKDMEDRAGDGAAGCKTAAVLFGPRFMRVLIISVGFACLGSLSVLAEKIYLPAGLSISLLLFVLLPLFISLIISIYKIQLEVIRLPVGF